MGYGSNGLSFRTLRQANQARLPQFKNSKGKPAHSTPDGSDWSLGEWVCAVTGEVGELANLLKKVKRGDFTLDDVRQDISDELADVVIYLDILAKRCDVDLSSAVESKFNRVSERVGSNIRIEGGDWHYV